jgi:hypothetical protein
MLEEHGGGDLCIAVDQLHEGRLASNAGLYALDKLIPFRYYEPEFPNIFFYKYQSEPP